MAFSPDGRLLASGSEDNAIRLWEVETGSMVRKLSGHTGNVRSVAFSPDGRFLASGSCREIKYGGNCYQGEVKLWDIETGRTVYTRRTHKDWVYSVVFSPDGRLLASGSCGRHPGLTCDQGEIKLWEVATGREVRTLEGHIGVVRSVAFSPDGRLLASAGGTWDNTIRLWEVTTGREVRTLRGYSTLRSVAFSPDGHLIAFGHCEKHKYGKCIQGEIKLCEVASGRELRTLEGHTKWVESVAFSPDGKLLASGSGDNMIKLWDVATGQELRTLRGHTDPVWSVAFSPDGKLLASGSGDETLMVWDISDLVGR